VESDHPYRVAWATRDLEQWMAHLADDVVLLSPMLSRPFRGKAEARRLYGVLFQALDGVRFTYEAHASDGSVFAWHATSKGRAIDGLDIVRTGDAGLITEIEVYIRPLVGISAFAIGVGPAVAPTRARRAMAAAATYALRGVLVATDRVATRVLGLR
jgi:ketosteroid isomerase-like protein